MFWLSCCCLLLQSIAAIEYGHQRPTSGGWSGTSVYRALKTERRRSLAVTCSHLQSLTCLPYMPHMSYMSYKHQVTCFFSRICSLTVESGDKYVWIHLCVETWTYVLISLIHVSMYVYIYIFYIIYYIYTYTYMCVHIFCTRIIFTIWLVVSTPLKNVCQLGWLFRIYGKIENVPNHQPDV